MTWVQRLVTGLRLLVVSFAIFLVILLAYAWSVAYLQERLPDAAAIERYERSGSGPWEHHGELSLFVDWIFDTAGLLVFFAFLALAFGQRIRDLIAFALSCLAAAVVVGYHFWLID